MVILGGRGSLTVQPLGIEIQQGIGAQYQELTFQLPVVGVLGQFGDRWQQWEDGFNVDTREVGKDREALGAGHRR